MLRITWLLISALAIPLPANDTADYRHPTVIAFDSAENRILTANSKSGTISVVDLKTNKVVEHEIGGTPRDLLHLQGNRFLVVDFEGHCLIEMELQEGHQIKILSRVSVEKYPQRVVIGRDTNQVYVSSLWSRRVTCLERKKTALPFARVDVIDFEFAPREMVYLADDDKLVVAGNFQGSLAVVDCKSNQTEFVHQTKGHNIRGLDLANAGSTIVFSHQMLNELAHTSRNDIHWGLLMSNDLRWLPKEAFLTRDRQLYKSSHMHPLGKENHAAGDPGRLAVANDKTIIVTISGTNEIAFGKEDDFWLKRVKVGRHPVDVITDSNSKRAYIANAFDDSISVFDLQKKEVIRTVALGTVRELTKREKGEQLFFDASLSHDGWMSCHSCHTEGHSNGGLNDNFTDGSFGAPKRVLSLLGRKGTEPLAWNGKTPDFETQVRNSIHSTMKSREHPDEETVNLLAGYLRTLEPPPSLAEARNQLNEEGVKRGQAVFKKFECGSCHKAPLFTTPETYDVGLKDELEVSEFNPPTLLGVSQRDSFFHDGRAQSLDEVIKKYRHKIPKGSSEKELDWLRQFLESL